jgi:hypothetical protein
MSRFFFTVPAIPRHPIIKKGEVSPSAKPCGLVLPPLYGGSAPDGILRMPRPRLVYSGAPK